MRLTVLRERRLRFLVVGQAEHTGANEMTYSTSSIRGRTALQLAN